MPDVDLNDTHDLNDDLNDLNDFIGISALINFVDKKFSSTIVDKKFHLKLMYEGRYAHCSDKNLSFTICR